MRIYTFILVLILTITAVQAQDMTVTITISPVDQLALRNDLRNIPDWIAKAVQGKINKTRERMVQQGIIMLREARQTIPADDNALINQIVTRPEYQNRMQRDAATLLP